MCSNIQKGELEGVLDSIINHMPVGLIIIDCKTRKVIFLNELAKDILSMNSDEECEVLIKNYNLSICESEVKESRMEIKIKAGVEDKIIGMSIYNMPENIVGRQLSFIFLKDITRLKEQEKMLKENFESEFARKIAGSIAHEIGNPLSALKVSLRLILDNIENYDVNKLKKMLSSMLEEVDKVDQFLKDFLMYTRTKHMNVSKENFCEILDEVTTLMSSTFESNNIVLINRCCRHKKFMINVDRKRLKQVLINILKNSVEAIMVRGFILINCSEVEYREHRMLRVDIADTGVGIKKDLLPRIFTPFFTTKVHGSGLGLSVTREIIEKMGGNISIESKEGHGTTVTILLPLTN